MSSLAPIRSVSPDEASDRSNRPRSPRILSRDGRGIKGYTSLLILKRVFRQLGQLSPDKVEPKPCEVFDPIVGTSTGGLIATMLGRLELSVDESLACYETMGKEIFEKNQIGGCIGRFLKSMIGLPFCDVKKLQSCMKGLLEK